MGEKFAGRHLTLRQRWRPHVSIFEFPAGRMAWVIVETDTNAHAYQLVRSSKLNKPCRRLAAQSEERRPYGSQLRKAVQPPGDSAVAADPGLDPSGQLGRRLLVAGR